MAPRRRIAAAAVAMSVGRGMADMDFPWGGAVWIIPGWAITREGLFDHGAPPDLPEASVARRRGRRLPDRRQIGAAAPSFGRVLREHRPRRRGIGR